jgi:predicted ester cyclase
MPSPEDVLKANKAVVIRFNREVIEQGNEDSFRALMAPNFINRTAAPGTSPGADGMLFTFQRVLRPAFPDLKVEIHDQVAEGDKVTTRKTLRGTHRGELLGIAATDEAVTIEAIDIVRLEDGRYAEHWGVNTLGSVLAVLRAKPPAPAVPPPPSEAAG